MEEEPNAGPYTVSHYSTAIPTYSGQPSPAGSYNECVVVNENQDLPTGQMQPAAYSVQRYFENFGQE